MENWRVQGVVAGLVNPDLSACGFTSRDDLAIDFKRRFGAAAVPPRPHALPAAPFVLSDCQEASSEA